jgi:hypothetical protein
MMCTETYFSQDLARDNINTDNRKDFCTQIYSFELDILLVRITRKCHHYHQNVTISSDVQNETDTISCLIMILGRWILPFVFVFSVICNLLNAYVFTRTTLRKNPCRMYLLSSSIAAFIYNVVNNSL